MALMVKSRRTASSSCGPQTLSRNSDAGDSVLRALSVLAVSTGLAPPGVPKLAQAAHLF